MCDCESLSCENKKKKFYCDPLHVPVSVRECTIDYLIETTCIYICALLCFYHVIFYVLIIMLISVKRHELSCAVRDMRTSHYSIIIIINVIR